VILTAGDVQELHHVEFRNAHVLAGKKITGVSTDSRTLNACDLFFAIKGENFDGNRFVRQAFERGALAAVVDVAAADDAPAGNAVLVVENTTRALGELARLVRRRFRIPILAIAGSNGKTTTKDMIAEILRRRYTVLSTEGNLNNHIGVPLTIFRLQKEHDVAVVEIGTNHPGEISYLCSILEPTYGMITNIGKEHLEFFQSIKDVANEEGGLFAALRKRKGSFAFVNADDPMVVAMASRLRNRLAYGFTNTRAVVKGSIVGFNGLGCAELQIKSGKGKAPFTVQLNVPGEPSAMNALAAATVGLAFNVPRTKIRAALEAFRPTNKRMEVLSVKGVTILNDTYNANPDSTAAALRTLARAKVPGKRIAVLADMLELGDRAEEEHARIGKEVTRLGLHYLLTYGRLAKHIHDAAGIQFAFHYDQKNVLAEYLAELVSRGDAVLVKGSRGMKMEDVVTFLGQRLASGVVREE
jgi:UDP-N-acetylmuramoyl-tripeptide--D-alanyl-D-alanine ligase